MYVEAFRERIEKLRTMMCVVRITKKHSWGHEPGLVALRFFDWQNAKKLRKELIESYEGYLDEAKLTAGGKWIKESLVPFAMVAGSPALEAKSWPDAEVMGEAFAFLFFDTSRQTNDACPVMMATTDSFKLREVAPSLEQLGILCVDPSWAPQSLVVLSS